MSNRVLVIGEKWSITEKVVAVLAQAEKARPSKRDHFVEVGRFVVTALSGHAYELLEPEEYDARYKNRYDPALIPILPPSFRVKPDPKKIGLLKGIAQMLRQVHEVWHLGDPDRAGQRLVDAALTGASWRGPVRRLLINNPTETGIRKAMGEMRPNDEFVPMGDADHARAIADWLFGMNLSRAYTQAARRGSLAAPSLSVGRVQTPTVKLVVDRDRMIERFRPQPYFVPFIIVEHAGVRFKATWDNPGEGYPGVALVPEGVSETWRLLDASVAERIRAAVGAGSATVLEYKAERKKEPPRLPFSLLEIQKLAAKRFGFRSKETEDLIQELYAQHNAVTYPRTDNQYLPEDMHAEAPAILAAVGALGPYADLVARANPAIKSRAFDDGKKSEHGKHGLIPTATAPRLSELSDKQRRIYDLIVRAYLSQFYPDREYLSQSVKLSAGGERFGASGTTTISPGWRVLWDASDDEEEGEKREPEAKLPQLQNGQAVAVASVGVDSANTQPPRPFTETTLLDAMANIHRYVDNPEHKKRLRDGEGLGSEPQRGNIIGKLFPAGYFEYRGKAIRSTAQARALIDAVHPAVCDPGTTALWDKALEQIANRRLTVEQFAEALKRWVAEQVELTRPMVLTIQGVEEVQPLEGHGTACPKCGKGILVTKVAKASRKPFLACDQHPRCDHAVFPEDPAPAQLLPGDGEQCPSCKEGVMRTKMIKGSAVLGCSRYPDCRHAVWPKDGGSRGGAGRAGSSGKQRGSSSAGAKRRVRA